MSYLQLGTIKGETNTQGYLRRKPRWPFAFTVHNRTTNAPRRDHESHLHASENLTLAAAKLHKTSILGVTHMDAIF
jgi:hypothetical protein